MAEAKSHAFGFQWENSLCLQLQTESLWPLKVIPKNSSFVKSCVKCYLGPWVVLESIPPPAKSVTMQWQSCFWSQWDCITIHMGNIRVPDLGSHRSCAGWGCFYPSWHIPNIWHNTRSFMEAGRTDLVDRPWVLGQFMRRELDSVENSLVLRTVGISGREKAGRQKNLVNM